MHTVTARDEMSEVSALAVLKEQREAEAAKVEEAYRFAAFLDDFRASYGQESTQENAWETE